METKVKSYKELIVYKKAYKQAIKIYELTKKFPREEAFGLTSQIRRASVGIPLCIAEGYGKAETGKELARFISMARGSSAEMEVLLELAKDFGYIAEEEYREAIGLQEEVGRMLSGLLKSIASRRSN